MPVPPYVEVGGERFVVPYVNYFPVNGGIVAPQVGEPDDEAGFALLRELFPDREVGAAEHSGARPPARRSHGRSPPRGRLP